MKTEDNSRKTEKICRKSKKHLTFIILRVKIYDEEVAT